MLHPPDLTSGWGNVDDDTLQEKVYWRASAAPDLSSVSISLYSLDWT